MAFFPWILRSLALQALLPCIAEAVHADGWRNRTIYQVLTDRFAIQEGLEVPACDQTRLNQGLHCGGTWRGIYEHLDYIQNMNFDAIWISPIVASMPDWTSDGEGYPGYWQQSLYKINPSFGTEAELFQLIDEVHKRGMLLMLDIVVNHMAVPGPWTKDLDYSIMHPFNDKKYYHPYCVNGYSDKDMDNLQNCWLGGKGTLLADLDSENEEVQEMLALWIKNQIWKYGVDGLRIDAAMNVPAPFFTDFMAAADVFATGETYTEHEELACPFSKTVGSMLNYPVYFKLAYSLQGPAGNFHDLAEKIKAVSESCADATVLGSFGENHDVVRFANYTEDMSAAQNMVTYLLTHDGIPIIYYGQEQHLNGGTEPYTNRAALWEHKYDETAVLYLLIAKLNLLRRHVNRNYAAYLTTESTTMDVQANTITFSKGGDGQPKVITVINNKGIDSDDFKLDICKDHGYASGDELFDVIACKSVTVGDNGCIEAWIADGAPVVLFKKSGLEGSTLCDIPGESDVELEEVYISSTTITATGTDGQLTVIHSATTMPWADAPLSVKQPAASATATSTGSKGNSTSDASPPARGTSSVAVQFCYVLFVLVSTFLIFLS